MAELDGDWVDGAPKWWWKFVFPDPASLWSEVIAASDPVPVPWLQGVTGEMLEAVAMLHGSTRADPAEAERLRSEAVAKVHRAMARIPRAELARGESA